jgi:hypothetical protein
MADWLQQPVDADTAVRIALLNNPGLQAQLARWALPTRSACRPDPAQPQLYLGRFRNGHEREIERQLSFGLVSSSPCPGAAAGRAGRWSRPR